MKKKFFVTVAIASVLAVGALSGCFLRQTVSVTSIEMTNSDGLVDYYTVFYSDGSTSFFTVTNGKDGSNAQSVTVREVYEEYKKVYGDGLTYAEFCEKFLGSAVADGAVNTALNNCLRSCVSVYSAFNLKEMGKTTKGYSGGSGVIYSMNEEYTYIVTNYHVVYEYDAVPNKDTGKISNEIHAYLYGSESAPIPNAATNSYIYDNYAISCEYIGGSISYDVAVIKAKTADITAVNPDAVPVTVTYDYAVGDTTYAIGNPELAGISVTEGIVSVDSEYISLSIDNTERSYRSIRTDAAITHGSSGGGLFNAKGELIGLNNAGEEDITFMNYAIPAAALTGIADGVIYYYNGSAGKSKGTYKAQIGIKSQAFNSRFVYDSATGEGRIKQDVTITEVNSGSLGESMGFKANDVLRSISFNGKVTEIDRLFHVSDLLLNARVGDKIQFTYERDGKTMTTDEIIVRQANMVAVE